MPNNSTPDAANKATGDTAQSAVAHGAPVSKLALAATIISVLAVVARCEAQLERQREPNTSMTRTTAATAAVDNWRALQEMSATLTAKARHAQAGVMNATDCDYSDYTRFVAARDSLATQLDTAASALGPVRYLEINNQLMALAMTTAEASDALSAACTSASRQPR